MQVVYGPAETLRDTRHEEGVLFALDWASTKCNLRVYLCNGDFSTVIPEQSKVRATGRRTL